MDATDRRVLETLAENGRATLREVAEAADLPTATVAERVQALEDAGVVTGYVPELDDEAVDRGTTAVFDLRVNQAMLPAVRTRLVDAERLTSVYEVTGDVDVIAVGRFPDDEAVEETRRALWRVPGVVDVGVSVVETAIRDGAHPPFDPVGGAAEDAEVAADGR